MELPIYYIQQSLYLLGIFILPLFAILLIISILISILQALLQIHEGSINYLSKLVITALYFAVVGKDFYNQFIMLIIRIFEGE
ncbi:MAG: flagellar biosynthetic protein FliQ [Myxococcota bacterium]